MSAAGRRGRDRELRRVHLRWFAHLPERRQRDHLHHVDGLPPRARVDLTTATGRIAAHAKQHRSRP